MPKKALYLLAVGQQLAELCELLCSVTVPSTLPDVLNYLLGRPAETHFWHDIFVNMRWGFQSEKRQDTPRESYGYEQYQLFVLP